MAYWLYLVGYLSYKSYMGDQEAARKPDWPTCDTQGCIGVRPSGRKACMAHLDEQTREKILTSLQPGAKLDLRGTPIDLGLLMRVLEVLRPEDGRPTLGDAWFDSAQFTDAAEFSWARFTGIARFSEAQFREDARFGGVQFDGTAVFEGAHFCKEAVFEEAQFGESALFPHAQFDGSAQFEQAQFGESANAWFDGARFGGSAKFRKVQFGGIAEFGGARFTGDAWFGSAQFRGAGGFIDARFDQDARFGSAYFKAERVLGPILAKGRLALDGAIVERHLMVEAFTRRFTCIGTEFNEGATIRLRCADVVLDDCVFGKPSTVSFAQRPFRGPGGLTPEDRLGPELFSESEKAYEEVGEPRPRLLSIRRVDVSDLVLADLDLKCCLFQGSRNWAGLRIEGARPFANAPDEKVWLFRRIPLWRRWTHRLVLAEEHMWRNYHSRATWNAPECRSLRWLSDATMQEIELLAPYQLELIYRALRKALEDTKNEPGAADFYYGEMEMRRYAAYYGEMKIPRYGEMDMDMPRHAARRWSVDSAVLTGYWLVSGYALRAWRAFATLGVVIALAAVVFATVGFKPPDNPRFVPVGATATGQLVYQQQEAPRPSFRERLPGAFGYSAEVATSLLRGPDRPVTAAGEWTQAVLRWLGPALFALALVSLRGRVKR